MLKLFDTVLFTGGDTDAASKTLLGVATDNVKQYFLILVSLLLNINSQYTWLVVFHVFDTFRNFFLIIYVKVVLRWKNRSWFFFLHNLKDIIVINNCAKFHPKIRWNKGSNLRVKFVFYTAAIKMTELGRMCRVRPQPSWPWHWLKNNINFLLTESMVITGKYQTEVLTVRTQPTGRGSYIKDRDD